MASAGDYEDLDPLEVFPLPVAIEGHDPDAGPPSSVRLFFLMPGGREPVPGGDLSNVVVLEAWDRVAIGLIRRILGGDSPDGLRVYGGERLIRGLEVSLDVVLAQPLGARPLLDASNGEIVQRVKRADALDTPAWRA
ncbi:MAG: hypothetical protein WKF94_07305 [Solirubrobacteraceae bacterium]